MCTGEGIAEGEGIFDDPVSRVVAGRVLLPCQERDGVGVAVEDRQFSTEAGDLIPRRNRCGLLRGTDADSDQCCRQESDQCALWLQKLGHVALLLRSAYLANDPTRSRIRDLVERAP